MWGIKMNLFVTMVVISFLGAVVLRCILIAGYVLTHFRPPSFVMADMETINWALGRDFSPFNFITAFYLLPMVLIVLACSICMEFVGKHTSYKVLFVAGWMMKNSAIKLIASGRWLV